MRFRRFGKTYQLCIETAEDLRAVLELDEALWVATSAPVSAFRCDPDFLALVDADASGRIHTRELKTAVRWLLDRLADRSRLADGADALPLAAIRSDTPEGRTLVDSAGFVLESLGEQDRETITLGQLRLFTAGIKSRPLNGDGIIPPGAADDPETARFIQDVVACSDGKEDTGGRPGISEEHAGRFMEAVTGYVAWKRRGEMPAGETATALMPLGAATPNAYAVYKAQAQQVDLFFDFCRAVRFDPRAASQIGWNPPDLEDVGPSAPGAAEAYLRQVPLAEPGAEGLLCLDEEAVNPLYRDWVRALKKEVLGPILGEEPERLSAQDWARVQSALAPYGAYLAEKAGASVEALPAERLERYCDGSDAQRVRELIEADGVVAAMLDGVRQVERLLLYRKHLMRLANNFVSFPELYSPARRALFEAGAAVIDGRWFNFAVRVEDLAAHSAMARTSNIFVFYLDVVAKAGGERYTVAVPATSGSKGNLTVGKRGIFFDTEGGEHDARITQIIENPISLSEAMAAPFVRMWGFVTGKIEALYDSAEKKLQGRLEQTTAAVQQAGAPVQAAGAGGRAGMLIGVSLAVAALGSALAFITKTFADNPYMIGLGLLGAVLMLMVPLILIAVMKLRRQDLSALLEGCGWSINARMRLNLAQRRLFTTYAPYPEGASGAPWPRWVRAVIKLVLVVALVVGAYYGARALSAHWRSKEAAAEAEAAAAQAEEAAQTEQSGQGGEREDVGAEDQTAPPPGEGTSE